MLGGVRPRRQRRAAILQGLRKLVARLAQDGRIAQGRLCLGLVVERGRLLLPRGGRMSPAPLAPFHFPPVPLEVFLEKRGGLAEIADRVVVGGRGEKRAGNERRRRHLLPQPGSGRERIVHPSSPRERGGGPEKRLVCLRCDGLGVDEREQSTGLALYG